MGQSELFGAAFREVADRERLGSATRVVVASRTYRTTQTDLWDALTNPERLQRWLAPVSGELQLGGRYQIEHNAGGSILHCDSPQALELTWEFGEMHSWVSVVLEDDEAGVRLTLEHEMPKDAASEAHWERYGPGATGVGWDLTLHGLAAHISAGPKAMTPEQAMKWMASEAGKRMMRHSAAAWGEAHIHAGEDPQRAIDMALDTAAFYTGET